MHLFLKILSGMANSVDPDQTTPSGFIHLYEGESISNKPNLFPVEIHLFFFDVIAL